MGEYELDRMMFQLKIYDSENNNVWDEVDGGVEVVDNDVVEALCETCGCESLLLSSPPDWEDLDISAQELLDFAEGNGGFSEELITAIEDVRDKPFEYAAVPFTLASYEA